MNNYKVCILAAGAGTRMGSMTQHVNKAVLPVNFKATISHIIEKFPIDVEIVIAVGHKKETIIEYVEVTHPTRKITIAEIKDFVGPGTGPGYSLLQCKNHLQSPFILFTADTIVLEEIPAPIKNWFGVAEVKSPEEYCTVKIKNNLVYQIDDKVKTDNKFAWIGLAGIYDYELFFSELERNKDVIAGEIQVSNGFKSLIVRQLAPIYFTWFDTGTFHKYVETCKNLSGKNAGFDFSKSDEFLYFVGDRVIKFFADSEIVRKRCERAKLLEGISPKIISQSKNFYAYKKIDGQNLYSILNNRLLNDFLRWAEMFLWKKLPATNNNQEKFRSTCRQFYYDKTLERISKFYKKNEIKDETSEVNGVILPPLKELLDKIDWEYIYGGIPSTIHGDLQFDNILVVKDCFDLKDQFVLLDWRQDFGGEIEFGDLYYDLAKLYGGMILSYKLIKEGLFSFDMSADKVYFKYYIDNHLLDAKEEYELFLKKKGFDLQKIKIITSLIFLNMSALHNEPFNLLVYYLGKKMLFNALNNIPDNIKCKKSKDNLQIIES